MEQKEPYRSDLIEAWNRFVDHAYTIEDLALLLNSIEEDKYLREFDEVFGKVTSDASANRPILTKEQKETYRKEVAHIISESAKKRNIQPLRTRSRRFRKIWYATAAAVLLGMLIPVAYYYSKTSKPETEQIAVQYVEEVTQHGEIKTVILPDSSKVTLNAGSALKYPERFTDAERSVELHGEALFDVVSDPSHPFTVKTKNMNVKVLGTIFNVKAYKDDMALTVSVASGKVEVGLSDEKVLLTQNQQLKIDMTSGNFEKLTIDAGDYLSWTEGTLYFYRTPIREVVNVLNRHYPETEIELAEGEYIYLISGKYNNKPMRTVLTSIVYSTGLHCKIKGDKYILYEDRKTVKP